MLWYFFRLSEHRGDKKFNPGRKPDSNQSFSICHRNLNSMSAHNYSNISLLIAYRSMHDFDIICLSETYLTSNTDINDGNLKIPGYIMYRVDHPSVVKRGGVCIYYKTILPLKVLTFWQTWKLIWMTPLIATLFLPLPLVTSMLYQTNGKGVALLTSHFGLSNNQRAHSHLKKFILLYCHYFHNSTKYGIRICTLLFTAPKLSPSNNICQI